MAGRPGRGHRETYAERRARRAAIDDPEIVLNAAARFLEARSRSTSEVRRHLQQAGYRDALVEAAVAKLLDLGMLDDATFARLWVDSRDRARPRSESALRRELALKGIDRELAVEVMDERRAGAAEAADGEGSSPDLAAATRLLTRKSGPLGRVADPRERRRRAYALLARNGFDPETCREAIERWLAAETDSPPVIDED
jgi:regulatory protein